MQKPTPPDDPQIRRTLRKAHLHYVNESMPGISRRRRGKTFEYIAPNGKPLRSARERERIQKLAIPPAYEHVWISPDRNGHLQAVGRDARGRKQYRYHPEWTRLQGENKYSKLIAFARALPKIRSTTRAHLKLKTLCREKVLAAVVQLLEKTMIRVGNDEYARENGSYGLTTLRRQHAKVRGSVTEFSFVGKHSIKHQIQLDDPTLARVVKQCQELPGQEIFEYLDENGQRHDVKSDDVNAYLREISGEDFTAKDFRTWSGTLLAAKALQEYQSFSSQREANQQILRAIEKVARKLGNTRTVCRKCYVHPAVVSAHLDGTLPVVFGDRARAMLRGKLAHLDRDEAAILALLEKSL